MSHDASRSEPPLPGSAGGSQASSDTSAAGPLKSRGRLFVLSGAGGVGKTSLLEAWRKAEPDLGYTTSVTTREPREKLENYRHVSKTIFLAMIERGEFVQWINPYGEYFGTLHAPIKEAIAAGHDMVFDYVPEGYLNLKRYYPEAAIGIFVMAPDMATMRRRLEARGTEFAAEVEIRYEMARQDLDFIDQHDYLVINDNFAEAVAQLRAIRVAERARVSRLTSFPCQQHKRPTLLRYYDVPTLPETGK